MGAVGIITGLKSEVACLPGYHGDDVPIVRAAGAKADKARSLARLMVQSRCDGILSFGMAGGLDPKLKPGSLVISDYVYGPKGEVYKADSDWSDGLLPLIAGKVDIKVAPVAGRDKPVTGWQEKSDLFKSTGALVVDMESHGAAEIAAQAGLPFLAVRVVADPAGRDVPGWVMKGVDENGAIKVGAILAGLAKQPWYLPTLILLGVDSKRAERALRRVAVSAGGRFGLRHLR